LFDLLARNAPEAEEVSMLELDGRLSLY